MTLRTKEAQRAESHKMIWRIANDLRGSVDGWDFALCVLGALLYRLIFENFTVRINSPELEAAAARFDYAQWQDDQAAPGRADTEEDLNGVFDDDDVNSNKLGDTVAKRNNKFMKHLNATSDLTAGDLQDNSIVRFVAGQTMPRALSKETVAGLGGCAA